MTRHYFSEDLPIVVSYNAPLTMIVALRSFGKTFAFTQRGIANWIKKNEQFMWVRRYRSETGKAARTFFDDITAHGLFSGYEFKVHGAKGYIRKKTPDDGAEWAVLVHFVSLSEAQSWKGTAFPDVTMIVFDEFIRELKTPPGYLPDDVGAFLSLYKTVSRDRENVHAYLCANACDVVNPYFLFAGIGGEPPEGFTWYHGKTILMYYPKPAEVEEAERKTVVGRLVAGTPYETAMINNEFANAHDAFIEKKPPRARYRYGFIWRGETFGIWVDDVEGLYYVSKKIVHDQGQLFTMTASDMRPNLIMIERAAPYCKSMLKLYRYGVLRYESPAIRERFTKMLGLIGLR